MVDQGAVIGNPSYRTNEVFQLHCWSVHCQSMIPLTDQMIQNFRSRTVFRKIKWHQGNKIWQYHGNWQILAETQKADRRAI